jgi:hypothetical protein
MNNRIKMTDSKFKCNIFLFLSVTVFMARLSNIQQDNLRVINTQYTTAGNLIRIILKLNN